MKSEMKTLSNLLQFFIEDEKNNDQETLKYLLSRFWTHQEETLFDWKISHHINIKSNLYTYLFLWSEYSQNKNNKPQITKTKRILKTLINTGYDSNINYTISNFNLDKKELTSILLKSLINETIPSKELTPAETLISATFSLDRFDAPILIPNLPSTIKNNYSIFQQKFQYNRLEEAIFYSIQTHYSAILNNETQISLKSEEMTELLSLIPNNLLDGFIKEPSLNEAYIQMLLDILNQDNKKTQDTMIFGTKSTNQVDYVMLNLYKCKNNYPNNKHIQPLIEKTISIIQKYCDTIKENDSNLIISSIYHTIEIDNNEQIKKLAYEHLAHTLKPQNYKNFIKHFSENYSSIAEETKVRLKFIFEKLSLEESIIQNKASRKKMKI